MPDHVRPIRAIAVTELHWRGQRLSIMVERGGDERQTIRVIDEEGATLEGDQRHRALARHAAGEGLRLHEELEWELSGADGRHRLILVRDDQGGEPRLVSVERLDRGDLGPLPLPASSRRRFAARLAAAASPEAA